MINPNPIYCNQFEVEQCKPGQYTGFGGYEQEIFESLFQFKNDLTYVDVGANVGYLSLIAANILSPLGVTDHKGVIWAFEPDRNNFAVLQANIQLHDPMTRSMIPLPLALGQASGTIQLYLSDLDDTGDSRTYQPQHLALLRTSSFEQQFVLRMDESRSSAQHLRESYSVEIRSLDEYFNDSPVADIIKMDIQGFEPYALKGMKEIIRANKQLSLFTEYDPKLLNDAQYDPYQYLEDLCQHFKVYDINTRGSDHLEEIVPTNFKAFMEDLMHPRLGRFTNLVCFHK